MSDLVICKLSHCSASVAGGMEMILLCEKVAKEDIQVRFFEEKDGQVAWEGFGDFQPTHVHKQVRHRLVNLFYIAITCIMELSMYVNRQRSHSERPRIAYSKWISRCKCTFS